MNSKIEIQPKGSYFQTDKDGFIINPASADKLQEKWKPLIQDIVEAYKDTYEENLKNVYVRGSVAKGEAIEGISDIDTYAYVDLIKEKLTGSSAYREAQQQIEKKYDFVEGIEMQVLPISEASENYIIINQSLCVYGKPVVAPKLKVGSEMAIHAPAFHSRLKKFEEFIEQDHSDDQMKRLCVWLMKGFFRVGFELTMERSQKYTRDLYRCYETFIEYYPEKESEMRKVLELALNPVADKKKIKEIKDSLGAWLLTEIPKHFEVKN